VNNKKVFVLLTACLLLIISACGNNQQEVKSGGPASLVHTYSTLNELTSDADEITEIKVISQETINYADIPFTISTVEVLSSLKGELKAGNTIRIIETGGEYTPLGKNGKELAKETFKFNGIPVLKNKEHDVIFLEKFVGPQVEGESYVPLGVYQGKFKIQTNGELVQQAPEEEKLKDYKATTIDKFSEQLKSQNK